MPFITAAAIKLLAKAALTAVIGPFIEEAREATVTAAQNAIRETIAPKMTLEEWADVVIKGVDKVKDRIVIEGNLRYIGGKLKFAVAGSDSVNVSFELYFLDDNEQWHKADAEKDIPSSKFTPDSLEEIKAKGVIPYEVE